jgi:hypothetical protein
MNSSLSRVVLLLLGMVFGPLLLLNLFKTTPEAPKAAIYVAPPIDARKINWGPAATVAPDRPELRTFDNPNPSRPNVNWGQPVIPRTGAPPGATPFRR